MLPGVSGSLLAPTFLERLVARRMADVSASDLDLASLHRWWRRVERSLGPASSVRAIADVAAIPFLEGRGYRLLDLEPHAGALVGLVSRNGVQRVAVRVASWSGDLNRGWQQAIRAGRIAGAPWAVAFSGRHIRITDARRTWSRRHLHFDLDATLRDERSATALVMMLDAAGRASDAADALDALTKASEHHGVEVCASLGDGVLDALAAIFAELGRCHRAPSRAPRSTFEESVTVVYRLLFLLFAEARGLVPTWHEVYRDSYTIEALCRRALLQPSRRGLWRSLQAISRLAHQGCRAGDLIVTPFNGRLFSPIHAPLAERARLPDAVVGQAVVSLSTTPQRGARERIAYADLGVEQLGAVYERVLEYEPAVDAGAPRLTRTALDRKSTGSFYTPRSVTDFLVRRALHPLVHGRRADEILKLRILDPAMGSGAFLVAALRYLADAIERALADEGAPTLDAVAEDRSAILRLVAQRCLYGVDRNPMAVQLARLSIWLASLSANHPLTFLDHHLICGDSLVGATLSDLARDPFSIKRGVLSKLPLFDDETSSAALSRQILPARFRLALDPDDTPTAVHAKERALTELSAPGTTLARWKTAADLWCATWFSQSMTRGEYQDVVAALLEGRGSLNQQQRDVLISRSRTIASAQKFFHWELEFPEAFFTVHGTRDACGGFDAVISNPPWEMLRADNGDPSQRERMRGDHAARRRFFARSDVYRHQGAGHTNQYQLFVERAVQLTKREGRLALIVPSGLAADHGCTELRRALLDELQIDRLIGFDNRAAIFPIHRDVRFLLLTATRGPRTERITCSFGHRDPQWLDELPDSAGDDPPHARTVTVSRASLSTWDDQTSAIPWLTRAEDLAILSSISQRVPPLSAADGWRVSFGRELNATEDRPHFIAAAAGAVAGRLPVIDGKHLEPFRVLAHQSTRCIAVSRAATLVNPSHTFDRARIAYRDVASATNRVTLIAARLPERTISTHTIFCSRDTLGADAQYCLVALLNSLIANYLVRLRVSTHVTTAVMSRLSVPRPASKSPEFRELVTLARALERTGLSGHDAAYARVNAIAAALYGLTAAEYAHVVSTFPLLSPDLRSACVAAYQIATGTQRP